jgi:hypothetical protein
MKIRTMIIAMASAVSIVTLCQTVDAQHTIGGNNSNDDFDYYSIGSSVAKPQRFDVADWIQDQDEKSPSDLPLIIPPSQSQHAPGSLGQKAADSQSVAPNNSPAPCAENVNSDSHCIGQPYFADRRSLWTSHGIEIGGWVQAGYTNDSTGLYNTHTGRVNLHQTWLYAQRQRNQCCGWDWGFRLDALYGVDAQNTQAFGNPPDNYDFQNGFDHGIYGWALPQAYVEVGSGDLSLKMGHFFSMMGYERVQAPENFFFSRSYASVLSQPQTLTGIVGQYTSGATDWFGGWTTGWDTGFDQFDGSNAFLGGFRTQLSHADAIGFTTTAGNFGRRGEGYAHSLVYDHAFNNRLKTIVQTNLVDADGTGFENDEFGLQNAWFYGVNCWLDAGTRIEWWKSDINNAGSQSTYAWTTGLNIHPLQNLVVRPEVRYNWGAQFSGAALSQPVFGIDLVWAF